MKRLTGYLLLLAALLAAAPGCTGLDPEPEEEKTESDEGKDGPAVNPERDDGQSDTVTVAKALPTTGEHSYLVILVETSDIHFTIKEPRQAFSDMLNKEGYSDYGGTGSARDYFLDQSMSAFKPTFDVVGPVTVDMAMSSFTTGSGLTKLGAARLFAMACDKLDKELDFSKYDSNGDGYIDDIFFYYAGYNSADGPDGTIWPHAGTVEYKQWEFDGLKLGDYACTSELKGADGTDMARIGNFCHEFAHVLGLPDFYDTVSGKADGLGDYSLMHSGCYNNNGNTPPSLNCEERLLLGWMKEIPSAPEPEAACTLGPISGNAAYKCETSTPGEYFCFEYRNGKGWDTFVPEGLVIYHVDKSDNDVNGRTAEFRWRHLYELNGYAEHECLDLVTATEDCITFGGAVSTFSPVSWNGLSQSWSLRDIRYDGTRATFSIIAAE